MKPGEINIQNKVVSQSLFFMFFSIVLSLISQAQTQKISFKDSLDHKADLSDWIITAHGFIPVPTIVTEPALGSFGGGIFAIFIKPNKPYLDSVNGQLLRTRAKPNVNGVGGAITLNGTWFAGAFSSGEIKAWRSNYRLLTAYANVNMTFYKELPVVGETSFDFNIKAIPVFGQFIKHLGHSDWNIGVNYLFLDTELKRFNTEFHETQEIESILSRPGILIEFDRRDNDFTPNKGFRWNTQANASVEWLGSEYTYQGLNSALFAWTPVIPDLYAGIRTEYEQIWGGAPFYLLPFINMRGIPIARYQGRSTFVAETEWRWDFTRRWSTVAFAGSGKAMPEGTTFSEAPWYFAGGVGTRYLIARKLGLRAGIDIARGPESWAYYIVMGSYWIK